MLVKNLQTFTNGEIAITHNIGTLHAKNHNHFSCPNTNAVKSSQLFNHFTQTDIRWLALLIGLIVALTAPLFALAFERSPLARGKS